MEDKSSAVAESGSALHGAPSGSEPSAGRRSEIMPAFYRAWPYAEDMPDDEQGIIGLIDQLAGERDKLRRVLELALRDSGCDGDLCGYRWHQEARDVFAELDGQ